MAMEFASEASPFDFCLLHFLFADDLFPSIRSSICIFCLFVCLILCLGCLDLVLCAVGSVDLWHELISVVKKLIYLSSMKWSMMFLALGGAFVVAVP